ncbi:type II toxin-antitoxin system VapC family toxin [Rhizobium sp. YIM 134829]|uniref:type II toxin-antitoxin system VapC family toxin n=1 Tax=Rhizobium sp. YIM 134829 TaxID=3390453 RepID=UPI00397B7399
MPMKTRSIDTNILLRLFVVDHDEQNAIVERLLATSRFFILWTVLVEAEWALRRLVRADREQINRLFRSLLLVESIEIERADTFNRVLDLHEAGMDFADAAHLCLTDANMTFTTFDRKLVSRSKTLMPEASVELAV